MNWLAGRPLVDADLRHDGNIFNILRWLLASSVMISHAWDLTQYRRGLDPTVAVLTIPISGIAVYLFFSLSGFLVAASLVKRGVWDYAVARALRLLPGLWVMLLLTGLGLGLYFTTLMPAEYFRQPQFWHYWLHNGLLIQGAYRLPGVFTDLPFPIVNGSLWTIPQEVRCYIGLAVIGAIGLLRRRRGLALAVLVFAVVHVLVPADAVAFLDAPRRLGLSFFIGVLGWLWRDRIGLSWPVALLGTSLAILFRQSSLAPAAGLVAVQLSFAYLLLVAGVDVPRRIKQFSAVLPDYSYGIYIYAFPVQVTMVALGIGTTPLRNLVFGYLFVLPIAAASWHFVESPALRLKRRFARNRFGGLSV